MTPVPSDSTFVIYHQTIIFPSKSWQSPTNIAPAALQRASGGQLTLNHWVPQSWAARWASGGPAEASLLWVYSSISLSSSVPAAFMLDWFWPPIANLMLPLCHVGQWQDYLSWPKLVFHWDLSIITKGWSDQIQHILSYLQYAVMVNDSNPIDLDTTATSLLRLHRQKWLIVHTFLDIHNYSDAKVIVNANRSMSQCTIDNVWSVKMGHWKMSTMLFWLAMNCLKFVQNTWWNCMTKCVSAWVLMKEYWSNNYYVKKLWRCLVDILKGCTWGGGGYWVWIILASAWRYQDIWVWTHSACVVS